MKRSSILLLLAITLMVVSSSAIAQSTAKPSYMNTRTISFKSGDETASGILFMPAPKKKAKVPAIVVIQEWWGLNDWVKQQAEELASQGYETLAVDLYRGKVAKTRDEAHELMSGLPAQRAMRDLSGAVAYLKSQPNVDPNKIGAIGWCMGGGYAAQLAVEEPTLAADVVNYGQLPE